MSESFEKWWKQSDYGKPSYKRPNMAIPENVAKAAYTSALLRAAEIAEDMTSKRGPCSDMYEAGYYKAQSNIAAAIRKEAEE